ncbi:MAG: VOC family protein [Acidimicrobiales bacterium]|nr:VOC family protein [Acidimicrobiales bacterium]
MSVTRTYFTLNVADMERAIAFYEGVLGPVVRLRGSEWSELKLGEATVALHASGARPRETGLVIEVDDLDAACEAVVRSGGSIANPPQPLPDGTRMADVIDTEGNGFALASPVETSNVTTF